MERRLFNEDKRQRTLALKGLGKIFEIDEWQVVGSLVFAGKISPKEWEPANQLEFSQCMELAVELLSKAGNSSLPDLRNEILNIAIENIHFFLANGYLESMKALFPIDNIPTDVLFSLIRKVEDFIKYDAQAFPEVKEWLQNLIPNNFHGKLIEIVGKSLWHYTDQNQQANWRQEIEHIARELCDRQELLQSEIEWLCSPQAMSVWALGYAMGTYDVNANCLEIIMHSVAETHNTGLAREYLRSLVVNYPQHIDVVNRWIDKFEIQAPAVAYDLLIGGGDATRAVQRALNLIDQGTLSLEYLNSFVIGISQRALSIEEFYEIFQRLINSLETEKDISIIKIALKLVAYRFKNEEEHNLSSIRKNSSIESLIWKLLELSTPLSFGDAYHWVQILKSMAEIDLDRAAKIASFALVGNGLKKEEVEEILINMAKDHPDLVMNRLGEVIIDENQGWHFLIEDYRFLFQSLPLNALKNWLRSVGVVGARKIAINLPIPYLDENGQIVIPPLTEFVLSEFEDDEDTFQRFCKGAHSLQSYVGNIASQKKQEAEIAKKFLNHPLHRIREWALYEIDRCNQEAKYWQQSDEEIQIG